MLIRKPRKGMTRGKGFLTTGIDWKNKTKNAKSFWQTLEMRKRQWNILPRAFRGSTTLPQSSFWTSSFQKPERINFCFLSHLVYGNLLQCPRKLISSPADMDKEESPEKQVETTDWLAKALPPWPRSGGLAGTILLPSVFPWWAKNVQGYQSLSPRLKFFRS